MKLIDPSVEIISKIDSKEIMKLLESAGRTCYKSSDLTTDESCNTFIGSIMSKHHMSVIEHASITVRMICSRGCTHQIVRHRLMSFSQESTRYCNYTRKKFGTDIIYIKPQSFDNWDQNSQDIFINTLTQTEVGYNALIAAGRQAQQARGVLGTDLKSEIVITANLRSWRHFLEMRTDIHAQDEVRFLANTLLKQLKAELPVIFSNIQETL